MTSSLDTSIPTPLRHSTVHVNGVDLHVVEAGPPDGAPVLLLHGFPEFWYGWRHQIVALASEGRRVVVPDQRGYNRSDKPDGIAAYAIEELVADAAGLIDAVGGGAPVDVVAHDWGGAVAWVLAAWHPERVRRLAMLNSPHPTVFRKTLSSSFDQLRRSWYMFFFQIPRLPEWLLQWNDGALLVRLLQNSATPHTFSADDIDAYRAAWRRPGAVRAMIGWYRATFQHRPPDRQRVGRIEVPTLVLWGMDDVAFTDAVIEPSVAMCDDGRLVTFDDATHWVQHDAAAAVNDQIAAFLQ